MANTQFEQMMADQARRRQEYGQRAADLPKNVEDLRKEVYGKETVLPQIQASRDDAIMQMWQTDKDLASRYANPESEMFIRNPYERESLVAGRHQNLFGQVSELTRAEEARRGTLDDIMERGVKIFELGLAALEREHGMAGDDFRDALNLAQFTESKLQAARGTAGERAKSETLTRLRNAINQGVPFYELMPRFVQEGLGIEEIRDEYNKGPLAKKEGPAKESYEPQEGVYTIPEILKKAGLMSSSGGGTTETERKAAQEPAVIERFKQGASVEEVKATYPIFSFDELEDLKSRYSPSSEQESNWWENIFGSKSQGGQPEPTPTSGRFTIEEVK